MKPAIPASEEYFAIMNQLCPRAGRNDSPIIVYNEFIQGNMTPDLMRPILLGLWSDAEFPCRTLPQWLWLMWFTWCGYVSDCDEPQPTQPLEVWRAQVGRVRGLSWTTDRDKAVWFHERNLLINRFSDTRLLRMVAPPKSVLATVNGRKESEVLINPTGVRSFALHGPYQQMRSEPQAFDEVSA